MQKPKLLPILSARLIYFLATFYILSLHGERERITNFHSDITLNLDRTIRVTEVIEVYSTGYQIRHGIARDLPTHYQDAQKFNTWQNRHYNIIGTNLDNQKIPYTIESYANGITIKMQRSGVLLTPGKHTFTITYTTDRQLFFGDTYDELAWNVTGSGWALAIDHASASIQFPPSFNMNNITYEAYTGRYGAQEKNYTAYVTQQNTLFFETTKPLGIGGNITIVAMWPKGLIAPPSLITKIFYFFYDNLLILWAIISLLILIAYYFYAYRSALKKRGPLDNNPIIPLFYPPNNFGPDDVYFLMHKQYDPIALSSLIVDLAVHGFLQIEHQQQPFSSSYILRKHSPNPTIRPTARQQAILDILFSKKEAITLSANKFNAEIEQANLILGSQLYKTISIPYIPDQTDLLSVGTILTSAFFIISLIIIWSQQHNGTDMAIWLMTSALYTLFMYLLHKHLRLYSREGNRIKKEIDGFKLFLQITEQDRMKLVGTPPTRTPELYEKYLPYAIALGVEKQWSQQFAPLFATLEQKGDPYRPLWYPGFGPFILFNASTFTTSIASSQRNISSSKMPPGSGSSGGGGGYSGGGGGGGGGRGI